MIEAFISEVLLISIRSIFAYSLVRLAARAFYDDITTKGENQQRPGRSDNRGIAVVILDALTRYN